MAPLLGALVAILASCRGSEPPSQVDARVVLEKTTKRYATCGEYRTTGSVTREPDPLFSCAVRFLRYRRIDARFSLTFARQGESVFVYSAPDGSRYSASGGQNGALVHSPAGSDRAESWRAAMAELSGVSDGTTSVLAQLVLPELTTNSISALSDLRVERRSLLRGSPTLVISGKTPGYEMTLWIREDTYELLRVVRGVRAADGAVRSMELESQSF